MPSLVEFLEGAGFHRIPLTRNGLGHFETQGVLNGRAVRVLIDTGAANTVISLALAQQMGLSIQPMGAVGGGAGGVNLEVYMVQGVDLRVGGVTPRAARCIAMDLAHVNMALIQKGAEPADVILGVDVFAAQSAVIDYGSSSLFLRAI